VVRVPIAVALSLSEDKPTASVTLVLQENVGRLRLIDQAGTPVQGARVYGDPKSVIEVEPGMYSLAGVPPGTPLNVRASGFTPTCRLAPSNATTAVVLDDGRPMEVQFPLLSPEVRAYGSPMGHLSWPGSDCLIALSAFPYVKLPEAPDGAARFLLSLSHFPTTNSLTFSIWATSGRPSTRWATSS
jgi:hypothetical protein